MRRIDRTSFIYLIATTMVAGLFAGCAGQAAETTSTTVAARNEPVVTEAAAVIEPTEGNDVSGTVFFIQEPAGVRVVADLQGLTPGAHGFHVHELGDCRAADGSSAGGHFSPSDHPHGAPQAAIRHEGDLGNVLAGSSGRVHEDELDPRLALAGPHSILGRAVIVHAGEDDLTSQPSGDAGQRIGCGVIGVVEQTEDQPRPVTAAR